VGSADLFLERFAILISGNDTSGLKNVKEVLVACTEISR
jgi:hypothetical protein